MRKLLRAMAKAEMERRGYSKVNRRMSYGRLALLTHMADLQATYLDEAGDNA